MKYILIVVLFLFLLFVPPNTVQADHCGSGVPNCGGASCPINQFCDKDDAGSFCNDIPLCPHSTDTPAPATSTPVPSTPTPPGCQSFDTNNDGFTDRCIGPGGPINDKCSGTEFQNAICDNAIGRCIYQVEPCPAGTQCGQNSQGAVGCYAATSQATPTPIPNSTPTPTSSPYSSGNCPIRFTPSQVNNEYNSKIHGKINIDISSSSACVFQTPTEYTVFFCYEPNLKENTCAPQSTTRPQDSKNLAVDLNLFYGNVGDEKSGLWHATICLSRSKADCRKTIFATGSIIVGADPTPTPPLDLPKIEPPQLRCKFQAGEEVTLTATNIFAGRDYQWWWNGLRETHDIKETATPPTLTFKIPGSETTEVGIRNVCVEDKIGSRTKGQSQHCITLEFFPGTPPGDTSCQAINYGTAYFKLKDVTPYPIPPPPCAVIDANGKCVSVNTAVGIISTDPQGLVRSIFSIVLGLGGGIALILIILSGYRRMASQGDPEQVTASRDQFTAAVVGLLFIIFAFVILQVIGYDILRIPGFEP